MDLEHFWKYFLKQKWVTLWGFIYWNVFFSELLMLLWNWVVFGHHFGVFVGIEKCMEKFFERNCVTLQSLFSEICSCESFVYDFIHLISSLFTFIHIWFQTLNSLMPHFFIVLFLADQLSISDLNVSMEASHWDKYKIITKYNIWSFLAISHLF